MVVWFLMKRTLAESYSVLTSAISELQDDKEASEKEMATARPHQRVGDVAWTKMTKVVRTAYEIV